MVKETASVGNRPLKIDTDPAAIGLVSRMTETSFGALHFVCTPERRSDEVMLFLHGFGSSWSVWTPLIKAGRKQGLLRGEDLALVDLPGFNKSHNSKDHLQSAEVGSELLALTQRLGYKRVRVVGHSMGGFLALDMAARNPKEVTSVHVVAGTYLSLMRVVLNPAAGLVKTPGITMFYWIQRFFSRYQGAAAAVNRGIQKSSLVKSKPLYTLGGPSFRYASQNALGYDPRQSWGAISVPVYAVFGVKDRLVSQKDMKEFQDILPNAKVSLINNTGHSSLVERPYEVVTALFADLD